MNQFEFFQLLISEGVNQYDAYDTMADCNFEPHDTSEPVEMSAQEMRIVRNALMAGALAASDFFESLPSELKMHIACRCA
jgi:hypothetical protein